ncbi:3-dehydroquinate synthase [Syntrophorhabdus aromaticivorans]|jgi:3-dehydroquinate synthase|uniref:3-dehydroquinate synthase n=1 Tax=Syntrophorhabdus aromaticivorans TaxID=328301 RepID=UPI0003FB668E|nr:3-dehydroquinate synthase [Syntrophorhabdus aromaticivorans]
MRSIELQAAGGTSRITLGLPVTSVPNLIPELCQGRRITVITDGEVYALHGDRFPECNAVKIGEGEKGKTLETVHRVYEAFLSLDLDRSSFIVGIGGGVVCDIAGFAASTYLRGLPFGLVPTTLLAQVDAGVGGKNGVNFHGYKNLIGTFSQPQFVLCDFRFLKTLPMAEVRNGLAEVIKHALIGDRDLLSRLETERERILSLREDIIEEIVYASLEAKVGIVSRDEKEGGERRKLNFGHTFGHAIEKTMGLSHGESVSIGMVMAAKLSMAMGLLAVHDVRRIQDMIEGYGLPTATALDKESVIDALGKDKKREDEDIHFVLLDGIGAARIERLKLQELVEVFDDLCEHRRAVG